MFDQLISEIYFHPNYQHKGDKNQFPLDIQVGVVLQRLANTVNYHQLECQFGISRGSINNFTNRFIDTMLDLYKYKIKWPTGEYLEKVTEGFKNKSKGNLENVIGAIDGSHIPIEKPDGEYAFRYINRKGYYSVILLGIVDHQGKFTYIYIGEPGSVHDARVLQKSRLWNHVGKFSFNK